MRQVAWFDTNMWRGPSAVSVLGFWIGASAARIRCDADVGQIAGSVRWCGPDSWLSALVWAR